MQFVINELRRNVNIGILASIICYKVIICNALRSFDRKKWRCPIKDLEKLGWKSKLALPNLRIIAMSDDDEYLRIAAVEALRLISAAPLPQELDAVRSLIEKLESAKISDRYDAIKALNKLGSKAKEAVIPLATVSDSDPDEGLRKMAKKALEGFGTFALVEISRDKLVKTIHQLHSKKFRSEQDLDHPIFGWRVFLKRWNDPDDKAFQATKHIGNKFRSSADIEKVIQNEERNLEFLIRELEAVQKQLNELK